jgi:hypothetical protein
MFEISGGIILAIQFWKVYVIVNEQGRTIDEAWDEVNLKFTFRKTVSREVINL